MVDEYNMVQKIDNGTKNNDDVKAVTCRESTPEISR